LPAPSLALPPSFSAALSILSSRPMPLSFRLPSPLAAGWLVFPV
jgi:hypothetical protein